MPDYPDIYPLPNHTAYSGSRNSGLLRSSAPSPAPNQISTFNSATTQISMTFNMTESLYDSWRGWVRANGYDWFVMPVVGPEAPDYIVSKNDVRFISDTVLSYMGDNWISVSVSAELIQNNDSLDGATPTYNDFIVAGSPALPATDIIFAGTPASPSTDIIKADLWIFDWVKN